MEGSCIATILRLAEVLGFAWRLAAAISATLSHEQGTGDLLMYVSGSFLTLGTIGSREAVALVVPGGRLVIVDGCQCCSIRTHLCRFPLDIEDFWWQSKHLLAGHGSIFRNKLNLQLMFGLRHSKLQSCSLPPIPTICPATV